MKSHLLLTLIITFFVSSFTFSKPLDTFFSEADMFLKKWVENGNINYGKLKENFNEIEELNKQIAQADLSNVSEDEKKAFYINAYNLLVIYQITKYYPIKSALDKSGFFDKFNHKIAGETTTLDRIEKKYLILKYHDPRIHFAIACAAVSCPKLASFAYKPNMLDTQLDTRTKLAMNKDYVVKVSSKEKQVNLSKIFEWYAVDFGGKESATLDFINKYRNTKIPTEYDLNFMEYNWNLNVIK
ncbi:DUF547 domain-containing protein [Chondrinema litorale]|uniref:DUF547 domain-containing protein n=1 Tax=Chondrinema litorale TaxID=2994555 RepID=UPI002543D77A|nr:DUF547 domain-containing protein [Chondrinema litorale]UZR97495.1 DUF547 domain-containing protein [Chondrinema litorale]